MSEIDLTELMATFIDEAADDIAALENGLLALERTPDDAELRQDLLRLAHTVKGNASCVGLNGVSEFAHAFEEMLELLDKGALHSVPQAMTMLLTAVDALRRLVKAETPAAETATRGGGRGMRVDSEKLNRMLDLASEIAIARGRVHQLLTSRADFDTIVEVERQVDQLQGELQELIMRARMVPIGTLFGSYARTVRDLAASHGKSALLVTSGDDVEVDATAVEMMRDPLTHMIRNAIDHGIEPPNDRAAAGKLPAGEIRLEARHEAGAIVIRVCDDGAGLDTRRIAERAGVDSERTSEAELHKHIFENGFSTASSVTDMSGRGVGMDVVRRAIESLRGTVAISTRPGEGTTFTIRLPLTLAMIDGFRVTAAGESYIVPMEHVVECVELPSGERRDVASGVLLLRDEIIPYVRVRSLFGLSADAPQRENVLIVHHDDARAGLVVDDLHGSSQAVIKPLGNYFDDVPGIAGSSILGDGRVALILDTPTILRGLESAPC